MCNNFTTSDGHKPCDRCYLGYSSINKVFFYCVEPVETNRYGGNPERNSKKSKD